jgi:hypothetical protein
MLLLIFASLANLVGIGVAIILQAVSTLAGVLVKVLFIENGYSFVLIEHPYKLFTA